MAGSLLTLGVGNIGGGSAPRVYATIDPSKTSIKLTLSNGNLTYKTNSSQGAFGVGIGTIGKSSGKWYFEVTVDQATLPIEISGIADSWPGSAATASVGQYAQSVAYRGITWGISKYFASFATQGTGATIAAGGVIGYAFDATNGTLDCYYNGVQYGGQVTGIPAGTYYPAVGGTNTNNDGGTCNFGATAFVYGPPSGYNAGWYT